MGEFIEKCFKDEAILIKLKEIISYYDLNKTINSAALMELAFMIYNKKG